MGRKALIAQPPAMNTACQLALASSFCTNKPPMTPPSGYPITISASAKLRQRRLVSSAAVDMIEASVPPIPFQPVSDQPGEQVGDAVGVPGPEHADGHGHQAPEDGRAPADLVGHAAEQHATERHAEQLHGEHPAERRLVDAPVLGDARGGKADRQDVEPVARSAPR